MVRSSRPWLLPVQTCSIQKTLFLSNRNKYPSLFEIGKYFRVSRRSVKCRYGLHMMGSETLSTAHCAVARMLSKVSNILHPSAAAGVFTAEAVRRESFMGHCYSSLVYEDLYIRKLSEWLYGEHLIAIIGEHSRGGPASCRRHQLLCT